MSGGVGQSVAAPSPRGDELLCAICERSEAVHLDFEGRGICRAKSCQDRVRRNAQKARQKPWTRRARATR